MAIAKRLKSSACPDCEKHPESGPNPEQCACSFHTARRLGISLMGDCRCYTWTPDALDEEKQDLSVTSMTSNVSRGTLPVEIVKDDSFGPYGRMPILTEYEPTERQKSERMIDGGKNAKVLVPDGEMACDEDQSVVDDVLADMEETEDEDGASI